MSVEVEHFIAEQEELIYVIASGLLRSTPVEEVTQIVYGAFLAIEATKAKLGMVDGGVTEAIERARTMASELLSEVAN